MVTVTKKGLPYYSSNKIRYFYKIEMDKFKMKYIQLAFDKKSNAGKNEPKLPLLINSFHS